MTLGGRNLRTLLESPFKKQHYVALFNMFRVYPNPVEMLRRYVGKRGSYPFVAKVQTPIGLKLVTLYCHDDLLTLNEVFCRQDYFAGGEIRQVVDMGANIGISALYFLTRNLESFVHLYEPVPANVEKLVGTLKGYESRYALHRVAVGLETGSVEFGVEATGRYGGIGVPTGKTLTVPCEEVNAVFEKLPALPIDILKLDVEGMEMPILTHLSPSFFSRIRTIYAEIGPRVHSFQGFRQSLYGWVSRWQKINSFG